MGRKVKSCARILLFNSYRLQLDAVNIKRYSILIAYNAQNFLEHVRKEIPITANSICHEINIYCRTCLKSVHSIKQRATFQQKIVLILAYRYSVKQPLVEISCQEIHIFIACLIHQIEQAGLNRLTVVFLSHLIL